LLKNNTSFISTEKPVLYQIYRERVIDWLENGDILLDQTKKYKEEYMLKICSSCSDEQQTKRKCVKFIVDGKNLRSCHHMDVACGRKFKEKFDEHMAFHPSLNRSKIIKESEKIYIDILNNPQWVCRYLLSSRSV